MAAFYGALGVAGKKTEGPLGGKKYIWYLSENGQPFQVRCICSAVTLNFGYLEIASRLSDPLPMKRFFKKGSVVGPDGKFTAKSPLGFLRHEVRLPKPDKSKK